MVQKMVESVTGMAIERKPLKNINFGLAFGMGVKKLQRQLGVDEATARKIIEAYFQGAPYVKDTMAMFSATALDLGHLVSPLGRRVRFNLWEPIRQRGAFGDEEERRIAIPYERAVLEYGTRIQRAYGHKALVLMLQMVEGDTIKSAMLKCWKEGVFNVTGVPRITVHDELGHSVRDDAPATNDAYRYMTHVMQTAIPLKIPVLVDSGRGPNWGAIE
jgi:DNA polymerase-1